MKTPKYRVVEHKLAYIRDPVYSVINREGLEINLNDECRALTLDRLIWNIKSAITKNAVKSTKDSFATNILRVLAEADSVKELMDDCPELYV